MRLAINAAASSLEKTLLVSSRLCENGQAKPNCVIAAPSTRRMQPTCEYGANAELMAELTEAVHRYTWRAENNEGPYR
jgi:hypothetical protein